MSEAPALRRARRALARASRADLLAVAFLVIAPLAVAIPFGVTGHPLLQGDNLIQNFPLRALAGRELAAGHLPLWDPWIWSGTPLLAGWNAGALYPGTWLFAFLPAVGAWTVNVAAVWILAGTGTYLLVRMLSCGPFAALAGALAFTWTGFMSGQVVHAGLVQGTALMPWLLVAIEGLTRSPTRRRTLAWALVLAVASSCTVLAGDPRAVSTSAVAALVYLVAALIRTRGRNASTLLPAVALGVALGAALSAVQWLPGLSFLHSSERGQTAYSFFIGGSLSFPRIVSQLLLPFLLGGNGNFSMPVYQGTYNLPEVTIGCGFLALVAAMAYLPELGRQLTAWLRPRGGTPASTAPHRRLGVWYATAAVGVLLTAGSYTPIASVLVHIPLFGGERLQNRNAALIDLGLAVLLGFFVDDLVGARARTSPGPLRTWTRRLLALLPLVASLAVVAYAWASPVALQDRLRLAVVSPGFFDALDGYLVPAVATAVVIGAFVLLEHRLRPRLRTAAIAVILVADLGIFVANASYATSPVSSYDNSSPTAARLAGLVGPSGRVAIYDPIFQTPANDPQAVNQLGLTDLNILQKIPSVQGYGSAVSGVYQQVTGTHQLEYLDQGRLAGASFDTLDLRTLLSPVVFFGEDIPPHSPIPVAGAPNVTADGLPGSTADTPSTPPFSTGPWVLGPAGTASWVLASPRTVVRLTVVVNPQLGGQPRAVRVAIGETAARPVVAPGAVAPGTTGVGGGGSGLLTRPHFVTARVVNGQAHVTFTAQRSDTVLVENPTSGTAVVGAVVVVTKNPDTRVLLDGSLQGALAPPHWVYADSIHGFSAWTNTRTLGLAWLQPVADRTPNTANPGAGSLHEASSIDATRPTFLVSSHGGTRLVWSEGYSPGWSARLEPLRGGQPRIVATQPFGLVQTVRLPPGRFRVVLTYSPRSLRAGMATSLAAGIAMLLLAILLGAWPLLARRPGIARRPGGRGAARRGGRPGDPPSPPPARHPTPARLT